MEKDKPKSNKLKNNLAFLSIGILIGATISVISVFVYAKTIESNRGGADFSGQMPGGGMPPEIPEGAMPPDVSGENGEITPPELPETNEENEGSAPETSNREKNANRRSIDKTTNS